MLDSYLDGYTDRLSREAPVPVVTVTERKDAGGGAANTAVNVAALGARSHSFRSSATTRTGSCCATCSRRRASIPNTSSVERGRRTLAKRRVSAGGQMLVRFDQGDTAAINADSEAALIERLGHLFSEVDGVIVSDYGYGVLTPRVVETLEDLQSWYPKVMVADAKNLVALPRPGRDRSQAELRRGSQAAGPAEARRRLCAGRADRAPRRSRCWR